MSTRPPDLSAFPGSASLTSMRGPLCYLVVLRHCAEPLGYGHEVAAAEGLIGRAELMLDSFFILSGFLIAALYRHEFHTPANPGMHPGRVWHFLLQRIARMYPLHLLTLLFVAGGVMAIGMRESVLDVSLEAFILNLLLMHSWGFIPQLSFNYPSWSISTEWFSYLAFPLLAWPLNRLRSQRDMLGAIALLLLVVPVFMALHPKGTWAVNVDGGILRNLVGFAIGCVLARLAEHALRWRLPRGLTWDGIAFVSLIGTLLMVHLGVSDFLIMVGFTLAILALPQANGTFTRVLAHRRLVWLGDISFGIYMIHAPVIMVLNRMAPGLLQGDAFAHAVYALIVCVVSTILAGISQRHFEMPMRRLMRGLSGPRKQRAPVG